MNYYIGIDGGGTKTQYALFDERKTMISTVKTPGSNHENLEGGIPEAAGIIMGGIEKLLLDNAMRKENITHILMALAGIDHQYQCDEMTAELKKLGLNVPFTIYNDGFIVVKAGAKNKSAIGYNCGTGTCCNSVDDDGRLLQIGGFGDLSGDAGGGHWIARETFRLVYDDVCLEACPTSCTEKFVDKFGITPERDSVLSLIPRLEAEEEQLIRDLIDIFFEAVNEGDAAAVMLCERMAERGARFIAAHVKKHRFDEAEVEVVLSGSIHIKLPSELYIDMLHAKAESLSGKKLKFIKLTVPPVTGCINWMLEK